MCVYVGSSVCVCVCVVLCCVVLCCVVLCCGGGGGGVCVWCVRAFVLYALNFEISAFQ